MSWIILTLTGPFLYATTNHIDKILLERYFKNGGVATLILFSSLLSALALPIFYVIDPTILQVSITNIFALAIVGILNVALLWFYFLALKDEEASITVVFYQLVPVFGYVLGYFILNETLSQLQLIAMAIVILGTTIISFEIDVENNFKLRKQTVIYMLLASFFWGLSSVIFKFVALEENVLRSLFWEHLVLMFVGVLVFVCIQSYRNHFLDALKKNTKTVISLNFANEILYMLGTVVFSFAYLHAPVSIVLLANSFQPIFVFIIGIFLTVFYPNITVEKVHSKHLWQKLIAISITALGVYLLFMS